MKKPRYIIREDKADHFMDSDSWIILDTGRKASWNDREPYHLCNTYSAEDARAIAAALNKEGERQP